MLVSVWCSSYSPWVFLLSVTEGVCTGVVAHTCLAGHGRHGDPRPHGSFVSRTDLIDIMADLRVLTDDLVISPTVALGLVIHTLLTNTHALLLLRNGFIVREGGSLSTMGTLTYVTDTSISTVTLSMVGCTWTIRAVSRIRQVRLHITHRGFHRLAQRVPLQP